MTFMICSITTGVLLIAGVFILVRCRDMHALGGLALVLSMLFGVFSYESSPSGQAFHKAEKIKAAQVEQRERTPRVVREADGCKVYAFKDAGRYHYFTRCPMGTSTESSWEVCKTYQQGKQTHRKCHDESEVIPTEYSR